MQKWCALSDPAAAAPSPTHTAASTHTQPSQTASAQGLSSGFLKAEIRGNCPGLSWDRVNFPPGSWHSPLLWMQREDSAGITLTFLLLLSSTCPASRTFQLPALCQRAGAQGAGRAYGQDS